MTRSTFLIPVLLLVVAGTAHAAGPSPGLLQGSSGITTPSQRYRFVTFTGRGTTTLAAIDKASGGVARWRTLRGEWGIPMVAFDGTADGLSHDGRTLVIPDWTHPTDEAPLRSKSSFRVYDANRLTLRDAFTLRGDFSYDALSPNGRTLYLIQHVSQQDVFKYIVRAYDLRVRRLLARAIADKSQQGWVMRGLPMKRLASPDGRWVYTLYRRDGGYPFVHALDSVNRTAVCIGIPWQGNQDPLARAQLRLEDGKLIIATGGRQFAIDTGTFELSQ
jgi:hypothetical protein